MIYKQTLSLEQLEALSAERPEDTSELFTPNDFYGHASILKQYCGLDQDFVLPGILPHGPRLADEIWQLEIRHPLRYLLLASEHERAIYARHCNKPSQVIGSPFFYARHLIQAQLEAIENSACGTIVFPLHSTHHVSNRFDHSKFIEHLRALPEKYHPVHICMYWRNIQVGEHHKYMDEGFECTTAGHMYDKEFLFRLLKIFASHKHFLTNEFGTSPIYAAAADLPVSIIKQDYHRECENPNLLADTAVPLIEELATSFYSSGNEKSASELKYKANKILGSSHLLSPDQMKRLFFQLSEEQWLNLSKMSRTDHTNASKKNIDPKIFQVNDHQITGGAAKAGHRLYKGLIQNGTDIRLISFAPPTQPGMQEIDWMSYYKKLGIHASDGVHSGQRNLLKIWYDTISRILNHEAPDIINLHNIHEAIHYRQTPIEVMDLMADNAKLVLTLHDMWYLTGRCAYSGDCDRFNEGSCNHDCPTTEEYPRLSPDLVSSAFQKKLDLFYRHPDIVLVCPSRWLAGEVKRSYLKNHRVEVIPYGIDLDLFSPATDRQSVRRAMGIKAEDFVLMTAAADLNDKRKGMRLLVDALIKLKSKTVLVLVGQGKPIPDLPNNIRVIHKGFISEQSEMARLYSAADLFVCPTLADNLPCVLIESIACGTPCIGFRSGGVPDIVRPNETGWIVERTTAESLFRQLESIILRPHTALSLRESCRKIAQTEYSLAVQARRYTALYSELISNSQSIGDGLLSTASFSSCDADSDSPTTMTPNRRSPPNDGLTDFPIENRGKSRQSSTGYARAHYQLGLLLSEKGDRLKARYHYQQAAKLDPGNPKYQKQLTEFGCKASDDPEAALRIYIQRLNANPDDIETLIAIGNTCIELQRFEDARFFFHRVVALDPGNHQGCSKLEAITNTINPDDEP